MSRLATAPSRTSNSAWPVCSTPERPAIRCQRSRASAASAGLPSGLPRNSSSESAPMTRASVSRLATAAALAAASRATCSATRGAWTADSSTSLTTTSGARPAWRSSDSRAGDGRGQDEPAVARSREPPGRAPAAGAGLQRGAVASAVGRPGADRRRPAAVAALGQRGDDDGERGELLGASARP